MAEYINLDVIVTAQLYDDEHEEYTTEKMPLRDYIFLGCDVVPNETVEIVRCRECIYAFTESDGYMMCENSEAYDHINPDGFCSWGKRREDGNIDG